MGWVFVLVPEGSLSCAAETDLAFISDGFITSESAHNEVRNEVIVKLCLRCYVRLHRREHVDLTYDVAGIISYRTFKSQHQQRHTSFTTHNFDSFMLKATSRLADIMAAQQQKRNIVIIGTYFQNPTSFSSS